LEIAGIARNRSGIADIADIARHRRHWVAMGDPDKQLIPS